MEEKPIFVKVENFKEIEETLDMVKNKIFDAKNSLNKIEYLKKEEENELNNWKAEIEDLQKKIQDIEQKLNES